MHDGQSDTFKIDLYCYGNRKKNSIPITSKTPEYTYQNSCDKTIDRQ